MKTLSPFQLMLMAFLFFSLTACTKEELVQPDLTKSAVQVEQDEVDPGCVFPLAPADQQVTTAAVSE